MEAHGTMGMTLQVVATFCALLELAKCFADHLMATNCVASPDLNVHRCESEYACFMGANTDQSQNFY